jgi:hypothetical protein
MRWVIILISTGLLFIACGEKIFTGDVNCNDCFTPKPDSAYLNIKFTINAEFSEIPFVIYRGDYEDNQVEWIDTAYEATKKVWVRTGEQYSVKAKYRKKDKTLYAIDDTKIKVLLVTDACDQECYVIRNQGINVEIRDKFLNF